ncbi:hypothetical protein Fmac_031110 [Flemingia macrophylla]|uniref:BHLH domain-containing protein n=1 Tax=Flemingia macrophylla TaxID=520843 RepID=A0ABD1L149_9FABA
MALSLTSNGVNQYQKPVFEVDHGSLSTNGLSNDSASAITQSPPLCGNANGYVHKSIHYQLEEAESLLNFKANEHSNLMQGGDQSFLSFQKSWLFSKHQDYSQWDQFSPKSTTDMRLVQNFSSFETDSGYSSIFNGAKEKDRGESSSSGWLYSEPNVPNDILHESAAQELVFKKRSSMGEIMQAANPKKPCTTASKAAKPKPNPSKDPQSVAAKNRRERISERLKILQELVPNGSKVDLVTMLEKAISYVKFLQLQVKVLAADEFWPVQGGKTRHFSSETSH